MWKRRVGVTARLRQIDGNQAIGSPQIASEMAAPPELRTPMGTAAGAAIRVRMEVWRQWRWSQPTEDSPRSERTTERERPIAKAPVQWGRRALRARMRRCLILRQGACPLRPPAPFPSPFMFQNGGNLSRVRKPRTNRAPLTDSLRSEDLTEMRKRGPLENAALSCLPLVGTEWLSRLRPRKKSLDMDRPSHGSRDRQGVGWWVL
jgi:hypothetical protein